MLEIRNKVLCIEDGVETASLIGDELGISPRHNLYYFVSLRTMPALMLVVDDRSSGPDFLAIGAGWRRQP
jgi:hypothetical protein